MNEKMMQHGFDYGGQDVSGYVVTEKYNGCRAYWDGFDMWTRGGLKVNLPDSWRKALPAGIHLDGEVYDGIDGVYRCGGAVRYGRFNESMRFMVFDCPSAVNSCYVDRLDYARQYEGGPVMIAACQIVQHTSDAMSFLDAIKEHGGEGLILRDGAAPYIPGRTSKILKLKISGS